MEVAVHSTFDRETNIISNKLIVIGRKGRKILVGFSRYLWEVEFPITL